MNTASVPTPLAQALTPRGSAPLHPRKAAELQAVVVIDRRSAIDPAEVTGPIPNLETLPLGWSWLFANSTLADLLSAMLADSAIQWSSTLLPEEQQVLFSAAQADSSHTFPYNGQLRLRAEALAPESGEAAYLIINGHQFPFCDLGQVMDVHRANRCDVTVLNLCQPKVKVYEEKLSVDTEGRVQRVDRMYADDPSAALHLSRDWPALLVLSASAMKRLVGAILPQKFSDWPSVLLKAGLRVTGSTVPGRCYDLHVRQQLHELADAVLRLRPHWITRASSLHEIRPRVWVGKDVEIAPGCELIGPLAIGDGAHIAKDCVIVGPGTIGRNAQVEAGTLLRRSHVLPATTASNESLAQAGVVQISTDALFLPPAGARQTRQRTHNLIRLEKVIEAAGRSRPFSMFRHRAYLFTKRAMDISGGLLFLCLTAPFYPFIALAIKLNSPGPVFYGHVRQGRGGRTFKCWKFRTMVTNAEQIKQQLLARNEVDGPQFKIKDDPRIFTVGRWLRRLNIDEWPQAINVLVGDMALVGPRPSPDRENQMCPAWREARLSVRPGITGLWQVSRKREIETDFQEWIYFDVQYVKKQSIWLDLRILFATLRVALKGS